MMMGEGGEAGLKSVLSGAIWRSGWPAFAIVFRLWSCLLEDRWQVGVRWKKLNCRSSSSAQTDERRPSRGGSHETVSPVMGASVASNHPANPARPVVLLRYWHSRHDQQPNDHLKRHCRSLVRRILPSSSL